MSQQLKRREIDPSKGKDGFDSYNAYDQTGVEWLGELPSHWDTTKVGFHTDLENGYAFSSENFSKDTGLPLIRIRDLGAEKTEAYYDAPPPTSFRVENGDIVIGMDGDFEVDRWSGEPALLNQRLCCLKPREKVDSRFLFYSLPLPLDIINDLTHSTTVKHLSSKQVRNIAIAFPSFSEQRAVGRFLDNRTAQIDRLIDKKERLIGLLEERRTALITKAVTKGFDEDVSMKDSGLEWLGEIPEHWDLPRLSSITTSRCDGPFGSSLKSEHYEPEGIRVVRLQNIGRYAFQDEDRAYISHKYYEQLGDHSARPGDLLIAALGDKNNPAGRACVVPEHIAPAMVKADCFRFRLRDDLASSRFVALQLSVTAEAATSALARGATRSRMTLNLAGSRRVALPPLGEQREIVRRVKSETRTISAAVSQTARAIEFLKEYRSALITAAVTGKIDVRDHAA